MCATWHFNFSLDTELMILMLKPLAAFYCKGLYLVRNGRTYPDVCYCVRSNTLSFLSILAYMLYCVESLFAIRKGPIDVRIVLGSFKQLC